MSTYSEMLKHPKWQKKRLEILKRDDYTCQSCFDDENQLHVHHTIYINGKKPYEYDNKTLITFCDSCHSDITKLKKELKQLIDTSFVNPDYVSELLNIVKMLKSFNPYELLVIKKSIDKYKKHTHGGR